MRSFSSAALSLTLTTALAGSLGGGAKGITCSVSKLIDGERTGMSAYTFLLPTGWTAQNAMHWDRNDVPQVELSASTPDKTYTVDRVQPFNMFYGAATGMASTGVRLTRALDVLRLTIDRMQRQGLISNARVVDESEQDLGLTPWQKQAQLGPQAGMGAQTYINQIAFLKVTFEKDGVKESANMGTHLTGNIGGTSGRVGIGSTAQAYVREMGNYIVGPTITVITPSDSDASKVKQAQIVASTMQVTPGFAEFCAKLALQKMKIETDRLVAESKRQAQEIRAHTNQMMSDFRQRMADKDNQSHDFCNYVLDQQDYKESNGNVVTLPSSYDYGWANGQGLYIISNDPTYHPSGSGVGGYWSQMRKVTATRG